MRVTLLILVLAVSASAQTKPSLNDTLQWIQTSLDAGGGDVKLSTFAGCDVTFTQNSREVSFSLRDVDYTTEQVGGGREIFRAFTKNQDVQERSGIHTSIGNAVRFEFSIEYGPKFAKAFRHATAFCGGPAQQFRLAPNQFMHEGKG